MRKEIELTTEEKVKIQELKSKDSLSIEEVTSDYLIRLTVTEGILTKSIMVTENFIRIYNFYQEIHVTIKDKFMVVKMRKLSSLVPFNNNLRGMMMMSKKNRYNLIRFTIKEEPDWNKLLGKDNILTTDLVSEK